MNPKHYSQIERAIQCFDTSSTADFLKDNPHLFFIFKKAERFVAALYILTELFPDTEPIKWELRSSGTSFSKDILSFREKSAIFSKENMGSVFGTIIRIASLLEIAHIANLVSVMNLSLFRKELDTLASFIEGQGRTGRAMIETVPFHDSFFRVSADMPGARSSTSRPSSPKTVQKDTSSLHLRHSGEVSPSSFSKEGRLANNQKDIGDKRHQEVKDTVLYGEKEIAQGHHIVRVKSEARKRTILEVLRTRNSAMIKDFSFVIADCSEKTVQRELLKMVREGLLKKEGERRWSRYSLI